MTYFNSAINNSADKRRHCGTEDGAQWRNEGGRGGRPPPQQPKEGVQKTEIWGKYCVKRSGKKKFCEIVSKVCKGGTKRGT